MYDILKFELHAGSPTNDQCWSERVVARHVNSVGTRIDDCCIFSDLQCCRQERALTPKRSVTKAELTIGAYKHE